MHRNQTTTGIYLNNKPLYEEDENNDNQMKKSRSFDNLNIKNIDEEENYDDDFEEEVNSTPTATNYDEKDEYLRDDEIDLNDYKESKLSDRSNSDSCHHESSIEFGLDDNEENDFETRLDINGQDFTVPGTATSAVATTTTTTTSTTTQTSESSVPNYSGKSKFYTVDEVQTFPKYYENERYITDLKDVVCFFSSTILSSKSSYKDLTADTIQVNGKLILTSFKLIFVPNLKEINERDREKIFDFDEYLYLFGSKEQLSFVIPLTLIYDIKATTQSDKYRKISNVLENSAPTNMLIRCKNFMTKYFEFTNTSNQSSDEIKKFLKRIVYYSNNQRVINDRFKYLVEKICSSRKNNENVAAHNTNYDTTPQRKSYLIEDHLKNDLVNCECDHFMEVIYDLNFDLPTTFFISTNLQFYVLPKNLSDLIMRKRVVINESNVNEFVTDTLSQRGSTQSLNTQLSKKGSRVSEMLGASPRTLKLVVNSGGSSSVGQQPAFANRSVTNPFIESNFPLWSFTYSSNGCSLIIIPECLSNRQEECEIIIKNYNSLLCDEISKSNKMNPLRQLSVDSNQYCEYEYYKFQVPFDYKKIESSYLKLMDLCSFKTNADYHKENESTSFYIRLHNTKWLKKISALLSLTAKIVNCLYSNQHNVFLEEYRSSMDASCILASLVKICFNSTYRTIVGFENLIQRDWFLGGHLFNKRLQTPSNNNEEYFNQTEKEKNPRISTNSNSSQTTTTTSSFDNKYYELRSNSTFAPTFLLFLDCVFQLTIQFPDQFEFNEIYLIHLWDYSCSSLSFTFSFDGMVDWIKYLRTQTIFGLNDSTKTSYHTSYLKSKESYLQEIFESNNSFWLNHLEENAESCSSLGEKSSKKKSNSNDNLNDNNSHTIFKKFLTNKKYYAKQNSRTDLQNLQNLILYPSDRMYTLKFWSRCYLRWNEKYHSYNSCDFDLKLKPSSSSLSSSSLLNNKKEDTSANKFVSSQMAGLVTNMVPTRPAPPPPTSPNQQQQQQNPNVYSPQTKPKNILYEDSSSSSLLSSSSNIQMENMISKVIVNRDGFQVKTRITPDGNIESSF